MKEKEKRKKEAGEHCVRGCVWPDRQKNQKGEIIKIFCPFSVCLAKRH